MKNLQEKIEKMLQGEQKRREVAIKFLNGLTVMLADVCMEMYGESGRHKDEPSPAVWVWRKKEDGKILETTIYFRYATHYGTNETEGIDFYYSENYPYWGKKVSSLRGKNFWWAIRTIVEWLPLLANDIDEKTESRAILTEKIRRI